LDQCRVRYRPDVALFEHFEALLIDLETDARERPIELVLPLAERGIERRACVSAWVVIECRFADCEPRFDQRLIDQQTGLDRRGEQICRLSRGDIGHFFALSAEDESSARSGRAAKRCGHVFIEPFDDITPNTFERAVNSRDVKPAVKGVAIIHRASSSVSPTTGADVCI
jgi:hypothetical protein